MARYAALGRQEWGNVDIQLTVVDAPTGRRRDVVLVIEPDSTAADAERALRACLSTEGLSATLSPQLAELARPAGAAGIWVAGRPVNPDLPVRLSPIREGAVLGLGGPVGVGMHDLDIGGVAEVRVVGGPDAGRVHRLPLGEYVLGSAHEARAYVADRTVGGRQARLLVRPGQVRWTPYDQAPQARLEGRDVTGPTVVKPGQVIAIGETRLMIVPAEAPDAALVPTDDAGLAYNRPPRLPPAPTKTTIEMPNEPGEADRQPIPVLMTLAPLAFGFGLWLITQQLTFLLFTLLSPVMYLSNWLSTRRQGRKSHRQQVIEYKAELAATKKKIADAARLERRLRRYDAPDPATVLVTALGPRRRLWERRRSDPDRLLLRLGSSRLASAIEVTGGNAKQRPEPPMLRDVPVTVALPEIGVLGIAGQRAGVLSTARWLVAQAATLHSPKDLSLIVLSDERGAADWDWLRWLPHSRPDSRDHLSLTGTTAEVTARRVAELASMVNQRVTDLAANARTGADMSRGSVTVLVLDGARALRSMPGMPQVLQEGPAVGVFAICLDVEERLLPEECGAVAGYPAGSPTRLTLRRAYGDRLEGVLADQVSVPWAERVARAMAAVRDVSREDADVALPTSTRLLDILDLEPPNPDRIVGLWTRFGRTTAAPIGAAVDGPFVIDMKKDGPHALVAGTTGAGKSELLQSIIASLAARNRPDSMTFVLIDYKGGAAFKDCVDLPHTVGMVTDLDGHLTERALASLNAELKRREHILSLVGAKDIEDYWDTIDRAGFVSPTAAPMDPMPRTVLVIDEFATLKEELGDFVDGLVGIAMRGRSLGVHLILATQRPSGVVSPVIRANTNLRIALRVTDSAESTDVIDAADAARIGRTTPGRGYARTGFSALHAFQTARVGGRRPGGTATGPAPALAHPVSWLDFAQEIPRPATGDEESNMETDLQVLVESIKGAARTMRIPTYRSPWLPPLPERLALADLALPPGSPPPASPDGRVAPVPFALEDLPEEQAQRPVLLDLEHGGHLIVAGAARAGRSTALRTLAGSIATYTSCRDVHLYAMDCGNAALVPLQQLPHCGAVVTRDQIDRADRLITVLLGEVTRRQTLLAQYGYGSLAEQRSHVPPAERLPYLVFLLDRWEGFMASFDDLDGGAMTTSVLRLLREGPGVGLRAVIAADRSGLLGKLPTTIEDKLVMRMGDTNDYSLGGLSARKLPPVFPPGRAFRNDSMIETQFALLDRDPSGPAQVAALAAIARAATERDAGLPRALRPARVDVLPARIAVRDVLALGVGEPAPASPMWALVGVGGDELRPVGVDLDDDGPGFVIGGPSRSGRSTALLTVAHSLLGSGCELVIVTPRTSPLRNLEGQLGVLGVLGGSATDAEVLELLDCALGPAAVLVDDGELLVDEPCAAALETVLAEGRDAQRALVVAGTTSELVNGYRGYIVSARKGKTGLLLTPEHPMEGELLGIKPPRSSVGPAPKGRGLLVVRGSFCTVQVPLPPT
jgi:S-DNA-T family DNA segregation ATPase FtsK/SpoIIIE